MKITRAPDLVILWKQLAAAKRGNTMLRTGLDKQDGVSPVPFWADAAGQLEDVADTKKLEDLLVMIERDNEALWAIYSAKAKIQASLPMTAQAEKPIPFWVFVLAGAILMPWLRRILDVLF